MRLRHNYLLVVIKVLEMFLKTVLSVEDKMGIKEIISSLKEMAKYSCFQWLKVTKMKANHNCNRIEPKRREAVSNGPKLLK